MTEEDILRQHPGLTQKTFLAVREYILAEIKSRAHDDLTGHPILAKNQLKHGRSYKGRCRNATVARWNAGERRFYHWREKFGRSFIETIKYPTAKKNVFGISFGSSRSFATPGLKSPLMLAPPSLAIPTIL